ncbi:MAG: Ger(x)C family spore germination protein [Bacillota bacterium]
MGRSKILLLMMIGLITLTGCWDKVEIDARAFIVGIGVDKFNEEEVKQKKDTEKETEAPKEAPESRYSITYVSPNTGLIAGKGEGDPNYKFVTVAQNFYEAESEVKTRLGADPFMGHTKVIVIGNEVAENEYMMREVLDTIERNPLIGRKVNFLMTPGTAKDVLFAEPQIDPKAALYIRSIIEKISNPGRMPDADLGYILRSLHESRAAIVPRVLASKDGIKIAGAAVLKDYKSVGWLGERETRAVMFMQDKLKFGVTTVKVEDLLIPCTFDNSKTKMKVVEKDGVITTTFTVEAEGVIQQHFFERRGQTLSDEYMKKVGRAVSEKIRTEIEDTYKLIQKKYGADVTQVGEYLRKHEPDLWEKIKGNWDEIFPTTKVEAVVDYKIRRVGVVK